jgi:hypothetical protein
MPSRNLEGSIAERARRHGIVVFENRLIHEAQPGIADDDIARVEQYCRGPLPEGLKQLWRSSFGGSVDYDLEVEFSGSIVAFSFSELFYPKSRGYRDLWGWIEHELELAEEVAEREGRAFDGRLSHLPIGGFEYLDRVYVCVQPGPDYGSVHGWMHGLPPAWVLRLNEDQATRIADDVSSFFRCLDLAADPFADGGEQFANGSDIGELVEDIATEDAELGEVLRAIAREAVANWRDALADGSIAGHPRYRRLALSSAVEGEDRELLLRLEAQGCSLNEPLRADGNVLDVALVAGKIGLGEFLFEKGVSAVNAVRNGAHSSPPDLVRRLLEAGSVPSGIAARSAALAGLHDSAVLIAAALNPEERTKLVADLDPDKAQERWKAIEMLRDACLAMDRERQ